MKEALPKMFLPGSDPQDLESKLFSVLSPNAKYRLGGTLNSSELSMKLGEIEPVG